MKIPFYKMTTANQNFVNYILNAGIGRTKNLSIALAQVISKTYAIPTIETDFIDYYDVTYKVNVLSLLGMINETFLIDIDTVERYVKKFMEARYLVMSPSKYTILTSKGVAFLDFIGVGKAFSQEDVEYIQDNYLQLTMLLKGFPDLLDDIVGMEEGD